MCEWVLTILDNDGKDIQLNKEEFVDMSPKSIDSGFNVAVHEAKGVNLLFE